MKKFWVYIHTCPNGKRYVGCTTKRKPEYRWVEGRGYRGRLFEEAILKYGWDNITHEVFEVDSKEEMYRKEIELISFYHTNDPEYGYNSSVGGEKGALGCIMSEEARKRISEGHKKKWTDPEYRRKQFEAHKGKSHKPHKPHKPFSAETKRRMSEAKKGKPKPKVKIKLPDGTIIEISKQNLSRYYINKGKKFEYVS